MIQRRRVRSYRSDGETRGNVAGRWGAKRGDGWPERMMNSSVNPGVRQRQTVTMKGASDSTVEHGIVIISRQSTMEER